jgi:hypothetical protein
MNATIYPTILTGLGVVITLIVTRHNLAKTTQQETNRRIDDLKNDLKELLDAKFKVSTVIRRLANPSQRHRITTRLIDTEAASHPTP